MANREYDKDQAQRALRTRRDLPVLDDIYRHYKGGLYTVKGVGLLEDLHDLLEEVGVPREVIANIPDTGVALVMYRSNRRDSIFVRTVKKFQERVDGPDGVNVPRFRKEQD